MNIFTHDDLDFSEEFYKYLHDSHDNHIQEKILQEKNNEIIKSNISKLEECIKRNLSTDNTQSYNKIFICYGFTQLLQNNNGLTYSDKSKNLEQYKKPLYKIGLTKSNDFINEYDFETGFPVRGLDGTINIKSNIIEKNKYNFIHDSNILVLRISNTNLNTQTYDVTHSLWWK